MRVNNEKMFLNPFHPRMNFISMPAILIYLKQWRFDENWKLYNRDFYSLWIACNLRHSVICKITFFGQ